MIIVSGTVPVKPDCVAEATDLVRWMMAETAREAGCITYRFYADLEETNLFRVFEEWESESALAAHSQSSHMAEFKGQVQKLLAGAPDITAYEVAGSKKLG